VLRAEAATTLTKEAFVARLKAGETWLLPAFGKKSCFECGGDGKLSAMQKNAKCPDCKGKGFFPEDWLIRW
jgi:hypothetical protein